MLNFLSTNLVIISLSALALIILLVIVFLIRVAIKNSPKGNNGSALTSVPNLIQLDSLKQSFKRAIDLIENHLAERSERYNLSWSIVINSGPGNKELPLLSSGLQSALSSDSSISASADGISWNFFDKGVVVQLQSSHLGDVENQGSHTIWDDFLGLCRGYRPDRPFDSIVISVPAAMLLDAGQAGSESLIAMAKTVNRRLWLAQNRFALQFPVYLVVDGCEHIPGFSRFSASLPVPMQRSLLGWSNPNELSAPFQSKWIDLGMESIVAALSDACTELCALEDSNKNSSEYFLLPSQVNKLRAGLQIFFEEFMRPSVYHEPFMFRGFYLSGDSAASAALLPKKIEQVSAQDNDHDKTVELVRPAFEPVFLRDLFDKKIFAEIGLVRSSSKQKLRRSAISVATSWGAGLLATCWLLGIGLSAYRLNIVTTELVDVIDQFNIESKEVLRNGGKEAYDPEKSRERALKTLRILDKLQGGSLGSASMPGSWSGFDNLSQRVQKRIEESFAATALDPVRVSLNYAVSSMTGVAIDPITGSLKTSTGCTLPNKWVVQNTESNPKAVNFDETAEFVSLQKYVTRASTLQEALNSYQRIIDQSLPPNGDDLKNLVEILFGVELNGNTQQIAAIFKKTYNQSQSLDVQALQLSIRCTYGLVFDAFLDSFLSNNNLYIAEMQYQDLLNDLTTESISGFDGTMGLRAWENLSNHMKQENTLLQQGKGNWIANREPQLGDDFDRFMQATKSITLIGPVAVDGASKKLKASFTEFIRDWDSKNVENAGSSVSTLEWNDKDNVWSFSSERRVLQEALNNLLAQPYFKNNEPRKMPQFNSTSLVTWDKQKIDQALSFSEIKRAYDTETAVKFPAQLRTYVDHLVYGALASKVIDSISKAVTMTGRVSTSNPTPDLQQIRLSKLSTLLSDLEANEAAETVNGIVMRDAISRLKAIDENFNQSNLFVARDPDFKNWNGIGNPIAIAFELSNEEGLNSYVAHQLDYVESLTKEADLLLPTLLNLQPNNTLVQRWAAMSTNVARKKIKSPTSTLGNLSQFILETGSDIDKSNCLEKLLKISGSAQDFDVFSQKLSTLQVGIIKRCVSLKSTERRSAWEQFANNFNNDLSGRSPFKNNPSAISYGSSQSLNKLESPPAEIDDIVSLMTSYDRAHKNIEDFKNFVALAANQNKAVSKLNIEEVPQTVKKFDERFSKIRKLFDSLIPAKEGVALGFDVTAEFRANVSDESEGSKIIEWILTSGTQSIRPQDKSKSLFWEPGLPINLSLRIAKDSPLIPKMDELQTDMSVSDRTITFSFNDPWALFTFISTHLEADKLNRSDLRAQLLRFEFPMVGQLKEGTVLNQDTKARVFIRLGLSPVGKKTLLSWPNPFPVKAPQWLEQ
jgi:type VI secretion system protein ImpL